MYCVLVWVEERAQHNNAWLVRVDILRALALAVEGVACVLTAARCEVEAFVIKT